MLKKTTSQQKIARQPKYEWRDSNNIDSLILGYQCDCGNGHVFTFTTIGATLFTHRKVV